MSGITPDQKMAKKVVAYYRKRGYIADYVIMADGRCTVIWDRP